MGIFAKFLRRQIEDTPVQKAVAANFVPGSGHAGNYFRLFLGDPAEHKKCSDALVCREDLEKPVRILRNPARIGVPFLQLHAASVGADVKVVLQINTKCVLHARIIKEFEDIGFYEQLYTQKLARKLKAGLHVLVSLGRNERHFDELRLRILTFTSLYPNNVNPLQGIFIHQRVFHLARRPGTTVEVIAPVPFFPSWLPMARWQKMSQIFLRETIDGVRVQHPRYPLLPGISMPLHGTLLFLGCLALVGRLHRKEKFDCIDAHFVYPDGFAALLIGKALGIPAVISARGTDINVYPSFFTIRPMIRWTLRHAAGMIAVSADLKRKMAGLGAPEANLCVISNGVDVERFRPLDRSKSRKLLGLPQEGLIAVSVGSLIESKGHHLLISAFAELTRRFPKLQLHIIGEGIYRQQLADLIRQKQLNERVFLMDSRPNEELSSWFSAADLSCLISAREGWPNVVSESLACGTPVLATRAGGIPEIITSAEFGTLVERDVRSIMVGLELSLSKPWNREEIASCARSRSWDAVAKEVEGFLSLAVERGQSGSGD